MTINQRYKKNFSSGWFKESVRHSLAAKGIKTRKYTRKFKKDLFKAKKYQYRVEETPQERSLRENRGYKNIITIDAKDFAQQFKKDQGEDLVWNDNRLLSARSRDVVDSYPQVDMLSNGKVDVNDGRHRLAVAAEKGLKVQVAVKR
jgi:hypothetical protein